jgi:hypothetical protein
MSDLRESWHFVALDNVPVIEADTPLHEAYARLGIAGLGGFLLRGPSGTRRYVPAGRFARDVIARGRADRALLRRLTAEPIGRLLAEGVGTDTLVPVHEAAVSVDIDAESLRRQQETVFDVVLAGSPIGYFMNHESVRETVTRKTRFVCSRGHSNNDPDHGTCYKCPAPIVRVETD